jgi:hypothetical protein
MAYFNVVRDNVITGQPTDPATRLPQQKLIGTDHGLDWGIRIGHIDKPNSNETIPSVPVYGNEVRKNMIHGPMPDARGAAIIVGVETAAGRPPAALGNIIEENEIHDMPAGVRLGTNTGDTCIRSNRYFLRGPDSVEVQRGGPL